MGPSKKPFASCLFLTQLARAEELSQSLRSLRACLLMFSASPATAAMEICCVWWTTKEEALDRHAHGPLEVDHAIVHTAPTCWETTSY